MKPVILASMFAVLSVATMARAQDVIVAFGDRYRVSSVNSTSPSVPKSPSGPVARSRDYTRSPARSERSVCRARPGIAGLSGLGSIGMVREKVETRGDHRTFVVYAQRDQGYRIIGAGGRIELDSYGRVIRGGLTYQTEKPRTFRPMTVAALERIAAAAVPHPREGPPSARS